MMHLQDQFRILQSGLIDYIDHLSVSLPQATFADTVDPDSAEEVPLPDTQVLLSGV